MLARAVAGEARCDTFVACSGSDFVEMYVGRGAARVRSLFQKARRDALRRRKLAIAFSWWFRFFGLSVHSAASQRPACAILFIDELDALAKSRAYDGIHGNDEREQTLNQLLTEMDGFSTGSANEQEGDDEKVTLIVIAASNRADIIDPAVMRRFDRQLLVGYPDAEGRKSILLVHARKIQCTSDPIDWNCIASDAVTGNFSGADLRNVINEAALIAVREKKQVVEQSHLAYAARRIRQRKQSISNSSMSNQPIFPLPVFGGVPSID
jgi:cell division protease FtsH